MELVVGMTTQAEDMIKEMVCTPWISRAKAKTKARAREIVIAADRLDITRENVRTHKRAKARARGSKESVITVVRRAIPRGNAPRAKGGKAKEKETVTKEKVKERGAGAKEFGK